MNPEGFYQMTNPAPFVWNHLVTPKAERTVRGMVFKAAYEATVLFTSDHPDFEPLVALVKAATPAVAPAFPNGTPFSNGTKLADEANANGKNREWARGKILFNPHSNVQKRDGSMLFPPQLVVLLNNKYVRYGSAELPRELAAPYFYSGVLAIGTFAIAGYEGMGGGVTAYLNEVLSLNSGERIAGGPDAEEKYGPAVDFSKYTGHVSNTDPTAGLAGLV
jgi:Protein of unknown function (DUF2815)